jgi:hypothetical protein
MQEFRIKVIYSFDQWEKLSTEWNDLLSQSSSNTIFLTWEWLFSWAECFLKGKRKLFIITVYEENELIGIAPWYIEDMRFNIFTLKKIGFLGTPEAGSDYLNVFIKKGKEKEVTLRIYNYLLHEVPSLWDCLWLRDIPSDSLFLLHFMDQVTEEQRYLEIKQGSFCPFVLLPKTHDDYLAGLSTKRRRRFKQDWKVLNRSDNVEHLTSDLRNSESALSDFFSFYEEQKGYNASGLHGLLKKFISKCQDKNWTQIDYLACNGQKIAGSLHLRYQDVIHIYQLVTDKTFNPKISIGNILVGLCLEKAINEGMTVYDFLKGAEEYKFYWANTGKRSLNILFCQKRIVPMTFAIGRFLKSIVRAISN